MSCRLLLFCHGAASSQAARPTGQERGAQVGLSSYIPESTVPSMSGRWRQNRLCSCSGDGNLLKDIGHPEDFITGCLCSLEGTDGRIHVVLPPAFGLDPKSLLVMYMPVESRGVVWANHDLIDNDGKNLMHDVSMTNMTEYQDPQMDEVCRSGLCLELLPVPKVIHSLPLSLATSELRLQLVSAHVVTNRRGRAETKVGSNPSVMNSSDHSKSDGIQKQNCDDIQKQNHDDVQKQNRDNIQKQKHDDIQKQNRNNGHCPTHD